MLHRLSWWTTLAIGVQMVLGGIIVGKDAGFACPNWPLCGKSGMPPINGSLILELSHRASAMIVLVLVLLVAIVVLVSHRSQRAMVTTVSLAVVSLILQVVVGGLIVLFTLPGVFTTIDVINSMIMLALFVHLSNIATREYQGRIGQRVAGQDERLRSLVTPAWILFSAGLLAVLVGALFRHTGASEALFGQNAYLLSHNQTTPPSQSVSMTLLSLHMVTGVIAAVAVLWFAWMAKRAGRLWRAAVTGIVLLVAQVMLGIFTLATQLQFTVATIHWSVAGAIVAMFAWILSEAHIAPIMKASHEANSAELVPEAGGAVH